MLRTDPVIAAADYLTSQLALSARFAWEKRGRDSSQEPVDYLNEAFSVGDFTGAGRLPNGFENFLLAAHRYHPIGFAYFEEVYSIDDGLVWVDLVALDQSAHYRWIPDQRGRLVGIQQLDKSGNVNFQEDAMPTIAANKLLHFVRQPKSPSDFEGQGALRAAYLSWRGKQHSMDMGLICTERFAVPTPLLKVNLEQAEQTADLARTTLGMKQTTVEALITRMTDVLKKYASHESNYLVSFDGFELSTYGGDAYDPSKIVEWIGLLDRQMLVGYLSQWLDLGSGGGSYALSKSHIDMFKAATANLLDYIGSRISGQAGPGCGTASRLLRWNFPEIKTSDRPVLRHEGVDAGKMQESLGAIPGLIDRNALTADDHLEQQLRRFFRLRPLEEPRSVEDRLMRGLGDSSASDDAGGRAIEQRPIREEGADVNTEGELR